MMSLLERIEWDEWRGQENAPTMLIKRLLRIPLWRSNGKWNSIRIDLHMMIRPDRLDCHHTHPAYAFRFILANGYLEEIIGATGAVKAVRLWEPGQFGLVRPGLCHRIADLATTDKSGEPRPSLSLWIRGPICAESRLVGDGWENEKGLQA